MRIGGVLVLSVVVVALGACSSSAPPPAAKSSAEETSQASSESESTAAEAPSESTAPADGDGAVRYLALGDSLTAGIGAPDLDTGAFPALLSEHWRSDGCTVELQNAGISGYTSGQVLDEEVPQIADFKPTVITFQAGGNDLVNSVSVEDYRNNVDDVLDAASDSGAKVVVLAQNEWFRAPSGQGYTTPEARDEFDAVLIEEAQDHGAQFVDMRPLYKQQADENLWVDDGIHPTPEAYQAWADELAVQVPAPCKA